MNYQHKKTKTICTIGPASWTEEKIIALYEAGMNVVRCNFSHKDYEEKKMVADLVHRLNAQGKTKLTLALDTKGPELRTGKLSEPLVYEKGEIFPLTIDLAQQAINKAMYCDYEYLVESVNVGDVIKIESGLMDVVVLEKLDSKTLKVQAQAGATIKSYRHVNLPGIKIKLP
jgi:pyruvate kinase